MAWRFGVRFQHRASLWVERSAHGGSGLLDWVDWRLDRVLLLHRNVCWTEQLVCYLHNTLGWTVKATTKKTTFTFTLRPFFFVEISKTCQKLGAISNIWTEKKPFVAMSTQGAMEVPSLAGEWWSSSSVCLRLLLMLYLTKIETLHQVFSTLMSNNKQEGASDSEEEEVGVSILIQDLKLRTFQGDCLSCLQCLKKGYLREQKHTIYLSFIQNFNYLP